MPIGRKRIKLKKKVINLLDEQKSPIKKIKVPFELTPKQLSKLYREYCIYADRDDGHIIMSNWADCERPCILSKIPWIVGNQYPTEHPANYEFGYKHVKRDLCFAIWHEGVIF